MRPRLVSQSWSFKATRGWRSQIVQKGDLIDALLGNPKSLDRRGRTFTPLVGDPRSLKKGGGLNGHLLLATPGRPRGWTDTGPLVGSPKSPKRGA